MAIKLSEYIPKGSEDKGLECRKCGCRHFTVIYTRQKKGVIIRLRECRNCGTRRQTRES